LARFNVQHDNVERRHFIGLPIPAAAEMIATTVLLYYFFGSEGVSHKQLILLLVVYVLAALMVSNIRYFSFKEIHIHRRQPFWVLVAIIVLLKLFIAEPQLFLFTGFLLYVASGPVRWVVIRARWLLQRRARRSGDGLTSIEGSSTQARI
jgi:CDP-diacylglycerol--serine O-phosphatidyltransferase